MKNALLFSLYTLLLGFMSVLTGCTSNNFEALRIAPNNKQALLIAAIESGATKDAIEQIKNCDLSTLEQPFYRPEESLTMLFLACAYGNFDAVEMLVDRGCKINRGPSGNFPLEAAASGNHLEIVQFLVANGAAINHSNSTKQTALDFALSNGRWEIAEWLSAHGGKTNLQLSN